MAERTAIDPPIWDAAWTAYLLGVSLPTVYELLEGVETPEGIRYKAGDVGRLMLRGAS